jgi:hypothetical protein
MNLPRTIRTARYQGELNKKRERDMKEAAHLSEVPGLKFT